MKNFSIQKTKGFTLVEIILYAAIAVVLLGAIVNSGLLLTNSYRKIKDVKNIQMSGLSAMSIMTRSIKSSQSIDGSGTAYGTANGSLLLRNTDSGGVAHTTKFYLSGGKILMDKDGVYFGPLTVGDVAITSLLFRQINTGNSVGVKIEVIIDGKNFYNTAMLRGSYQ